MLSQVVRLRQVLHHNHIQVIDFGYDEEQNEIERLKDPELRDPHCTFPKT